MAKFVLIYRGGQMGETPAEQEALMAKWGAWFGTLGAAVCDMGAPFGASVTVGAAGTIDSPATRSSRSVRSPKPSALRRRAR